MADWDFQEVSNLAADLTRRSNQIEPGAEKILGKTAADVTKDAKVLAPYEFGNLQNSIGYTGEGLEYEVSPTANYGIYQELGTSTMAAQPFMAPALERNKPPMLAAFDQLVGGGWGG